MLHWLPAHSALQVLCARRDNVCSAPSSDTTTDCVHVLFQLHTCMFCSSYTHTKLRCPHQCNHGVA